jgi:hypothetical protein
MVTEVKTHKGDTYEQSGNFGAAVAVFFGLLEISDRAFKKASHSVKTLSNAENFPLPVALTQPQ